MKTCLPALAAAVCFSGSAALAGPAGTGLTHTLAVAHAAASSIVIADRDPECLARVAQAAVGWRDVRARSSKKDGLTLTFYSPRAAAAAAPAVQELIASACDGQTASRVRAKTNDDR